jgi:hypothetical protein
MQTAPFLSVIIFLFCLKTVLSAADSAMISVHDSAMHHLIQQQYGPAKNLLAAHCGKHPDDLKARYLLFAVEQTRILDYESYIIEQKNFQKMAEKLKNYFEDRIVGLSGYDSTLCLFYLANVYGGIGVMQAKTGDWFKGVKNALTSVSLLKQVKKRKPDFYAADLGIGIFDYYLSTSLRWLPFVVNKEREGLEAIERALNAEFPYNHAAKNSFCWILIERNNFRRADSIAHSILDEYPDNTIFLRIKALIGLWSQKYEDGLKYGRHLLELTEKRMPLNWSDLIAGYMVLVQSYDEMGKHEDACREADAILSRRIPTTYMSIPHIKKNIKYLKGIRNKCQRKR